MQSYTHDKADTRRSRAANIECSDVSRSLYLVPTRRTCDLFIGIKDHAHARGPDGMASADQTSTGIDGQLSIQINGPLFNSFPTLPGSCQAKMVDGHIFADSKAIMSLDTIHFPDVKDVWEMDCIET